jgi:hypothetical protein
MATENSTTVEQSEEDAAEKFEAVAVQFEDETIRKFKVDTAKQEFLALTRIAMNYQRMEEALTECWVGDGNSLCEKTHNLVGGILADLEMSLL